VLATPLTVCLVVLAGNEMYQEDRERGRREFLPARQLAGDEKHTVQRKAKRQIAHRFRRQYNLDVQKRTFLKTAPTPHMTAFEHKQPPERRVEHTFIPQRTRHGRRGHGLASDDLCSCLMHNLISGRTRMVRTQVPHACGKEATRIERPIYTTACCQP
jgi:hypothetical protein